MKIRGLHCGFLLLGASLLGGCATLGYVPEKPETRDGAPDQVPYDLHSLPDPVPTQEPPSRYGNPPSYKVLGKTYATLQSSAGYRAEGLASWYGRKFHGQRTSSGEPYDMFQLTAAHRTLPIPTYVRVTNLENGRQTLVRVNDRGPFHDHRILDLSYAAAVKLGFAEKGTARIRIEALDNGGGLAQELYLQAGAFRKLVAARKMQQKLQKLQNLTGERTVVVQRPQDTLYRVRIGPVADEQRARLLQSMVVAAGFAKPLIMRLGGR